MAVYGPDDYVLGSDGQYYDPNATPPPGVRLNGMPTQTATPGSPGGPQLSTPQGGQLITTPNSSTGQPIRQAPSASSFPAPATGAPNTLTPSSRTGAPAPGIRTLELPPGTNAATMPGWFGPAASALTRGGLYGLGGYLMGKTIEPQPTNTGEDAVLKRFQPAPNTTIGTQTGAPTIAPGSQTSPVTQPGSAPQFGPPVPPGGVPPTAPPPFGPAGPPLPPVRPQGFVPPFAPGRPAPRAPQGYNLGYGGQTPAAAAAPPAAPSSMFTSIDRPNADVAGGRSVAGQLAPQYFNPAREPGGPAQMGALDLSGLFNHPAVAAAAAAHPAVQGALAQQNAQQQQQAPTARAVQRQPFSNSKFFGNPANWQYPNMPF